MRPLGASDREEAALNERSYRGSAATKDRIVDAPVGRVGTGRGRAQRAQLQGGRSYRGGEATKDRTVDAPAGRVGSGGSRAQRAQLQGDRSYRGGAARIVDAPAGLQRECSLAVARGSVACGWKKGTARDGSPSLRGGRFRRHLIADAFAERVGSDFLVLRRPSDLTMKPEHI